MNKLVECVPNFSEGRDESIIKTIVDHIQSVDNVTVLDVDSGKDTNRTVVTIVGEPMAVAESAFRGIMIASELIDMNSHKGTHPRIGATDVCPFIPVSSISEEECIKISKIFKLGYGGIDLKITKNDVFVLEINSIPSWKAMQKISKINISEKLVKDFIKNVKKWKFV